MTHIHINQLGYRPRDKKIFIINTDSCSTFNIINSVTGQSVFSSKLEKGLKDKATSDTISYGDFSQLTTKGSYFISLSEDCKSLNFNIDETAYVPVQDALLKALYFQRCGTKLDAEFAGVWCHDICHIAKAKLYEDPYKELDVSGGWHDAGDYGRYVVPAAKAVADLLLSYELFPNSFKNPIGIPESNNGIPDILNEAKYELQWLLKMQDNLSGGVYNKVATQQFPAMIMPEADTAPLIIYPISSPATGDFAAVMALASRIYFNIDKPLSELCLAASEKAWTWLINNPVKLYKNEPDVGSGEYGDNNDLDEKLWAACELYRTTNKLEYKDYINYNFDKLEDTISLGWADVGGYASISYLLNPNNDSDSSLYNKVKSNFTSQADLLVDICKKDGYKATLKADQYVWGSNMSILNNAMFLIISNTLNANPDYIEAACHQWNYIFGANSLNQCYVTGYGANPIMHPHHRPSEADGITSPVPGLVSGGPCSGLYDEAAKKYCKGHSPAKCFVDHVESYSTNEITVYWNSPAVFVAGFLNSN